MYALDLQDFRGLKATIKAYLGYHIQPERNNIGCSDAAKTLLHYADHAGLITEEDLEGVDVNEMIFFDNESWEIVMKCVITLNSGGSIQGMEGAIKMLEELVSMRMEH